jgi:hypothetical protein
MRLLVRALGVALIVLGALATVVTAMSGGAAFIVLPLLVAIAGGLLVFASVRYDLGRTR